MRLMPAMSEWVQANTSILQSRTCCICSFSAPGRRELTYVDLSGPYKRELRPIAPCPPPLPGWRDVTAIFQSGLQVSDCRSFRFSNTLALTIGSTIGLLVGCLGGKFAQQLSDS